MFEATDEESYRQLNELWDELDHLQGLEADRQAPTGTEDEVMMRQLERASRINSQRYLVGKMAITSAFSKTARMFVVSLNQTDHTSGLAPEGVRGYMALDEDNPYLVGLYARAARMTATALTESLEMRTTLINQNINTFPEPY